MDYKEFMSVFSFDAEECAKEKASRWNLCLCSTSKVSVETTLSFPQPSSCVIICIICIIFMFSNVLLRINISY